MNFKELFKARPADQESKEWMITFGNMLATEQTFKTKKAAELAIAKTDWNLVACIAAAIVRAEKLKENEEFVTTEEQGGVK